MLTAEEEADHGQAQVVPQSELDALDMYPDSQRAAALHTALRGLAKRQRKPGSGAEVANTHLKDKERSSAAPSS
jgi:hypothetical protein